jgi:hypothetical protein
MTSYGQVDKSWFEHDQVDQTGPARARLTKVYLDVTKLTKWNQ